MLIIDNVSKRYPTGDLALRNVSLNVPRGQVVGLIGPSGAGKSTLLRCINRLEEPSEGIVKLNDLEVTSLSSSSLRRARRSMGMIFQDFALVDRLSVMENILSGRLGYVNFWQSFSRRFPQADINRAFVVLERVGLLDFVDKRADALSGGERQRVGIARAIVQEPELLLVDEPTASLDPRVSIQIMRLIVELCAERQMAAIINIHDVALARMFVDRIVGIRQGMIVFDGPSEMLSNEVLSEIYGAEQEVLNSPVSPAVTI